MQTPPPPGIGNFSSGLDLENFKLAFKNWSSPTPIPLPDNGNFSSGLDLENFKLAFENWYLPPSPSPQNMEISAHDWT